MKSDITIILLLYKTPLELIKNFKAFRKFNVIVLDQSNDRVFKKKLLKILPKIKNYTISKDNNGYAKGINILVKKVKTKYFFCSQADVSINENSILELRKTILRKKKNAVIAIPSINKKIKKKVKEIQVKNMIGATFLCDTKKFIEIGMFDEDFFFYWEDIELSQRIKSFKYKIYESQRSKATHRNGNSSLVGFKTDFIRYGNFIFGEFLYDYKIKKIRTLKLLRKLSQNILLLIVNIFLLKFRNANICFSKVLGIIRFMWFILKRYL
ncbi:glycosyltransferase [Pelagibacterales bacterium SAG-MED39]|nr:glycosyltransferase [Pelagibacterales bacterium SAG-MED39]